MFNTCLQVRGFPVLLPVPLPGLSAPSKTVSRASAREQKRGGGSPAPAAPAALSRPP